jgi:hypothetical protein
VYPPLATQENGSRTVWLLASKLRSWLSEAREVSVKKISRGPLGDRLDMLVAKT